MDVAVPVVVAVFLVMLILGPPREDPPWTLVGVIAGIAQGAALYWRRSHPIRVMLIALAGGLTIQLIFPDGVFPYAGLIAIGSLAAARPPRVSLLALAALLGLTALNYFTQRAYEESGEHMLAAALLAPTGGPALRTLRDETVNGASRAAQPDLRRAEAQAPARDLGGAWRAIRLSVSEPQSAAALAVVRATRSRPPSSAPAATW